MSEFKPSGVLNKAELACVSGGSHVVVICSHGNLQDNENKEAVTCDSNKVILQFQLVCMDLHPKWYLSMVCLNTCNKMVLQPPSAHTSQVYVFDMNYH